MVRGVKISQFYKFYKFISNFEKLPFKFSTKRELDHWRERFVQRNDQFPFSPATIRYRFRRNGWNAKGQWNIGKCLNMPASVRTYRGTNASMKYRSKSFLQLTSLCFTCQFSLSYNSFSLVNVYSLSLIPRKYIEFCIEIRETLWGVKLFLLPFYRAKNLLYMGKLIFFFYLCTVSFNSLRRDIFKIF